MESALQDVAEAAAAAANAGVAAAVFVVMPHCHKANAGVLPLPINPPSRDEAILLSQGVPTANAKVHNHKDGDKFKILLNQDSKVY